MGPATDYSSEDKTTIQLDDEFHQFDGVGLSELVKNGEVTASELVDVVIQRIERVNPKLNFVSTETYDLAYQAAQRSIPDGPFSGVPYLMKDMGVKWQGVPLTNGSVAYKDSISKADCFDGIKAKAAGFILTATTTAPEGAWSGSTESDLQGATLNPWDITRTPGGSSGGSAAAVAARVVPLASGSDGGGSLRIPASFTGILGLKPTRGRIQFGPLVPEGQNGFITRGCMSLTVRDSAAYLDAFCGNYPGDAYICHPPEDSFLSLSSRDVGKLRIGVTTQCPSGTEVWGPAINAVRETAALCENLGHNIEKINYRFDYEHLAEIVTRLEAVHHARDFEAIKLHLGREPVEGEIMRFLHMSAEYGRSQSALQYAQDIASMRLLAREIAVETEAYDVVLTPTMPVKTPKIGWLDMNNTPFDLYNQELCKKILPFGMPFNCSGAPAISVPLGFCNKEQLPVGVQFIGKYGDDALLLQLANQLEKEKPWAEMIPPVNALPKTIV